MMSHLKYKSILTASLLVLGQFIFAQSNLPIIRATSRSVTIRDGLHFKKQYWYIFPERKPDYYYVEIPGKEHKVTFLTDQDSISFDVKYGGEYNFIILLNNRDSCYTRIVAKYKSLISYTPNHIAAGDDTIPFTIGNNSKVYLKGTINNSEPLNIQLDLGSMGCIIKKSSVKKVEMIFNRSVTLTNSDGTNDVPLSEGNILQIANLKWDSIAFAVADNMTSREDLIIGNSLFLAKVIEINYDKKIIIIHDTLPSRYTSYSRHGLILDGGIVPFIQGSLTINSKTMTGWFMFDLGAYTTILQTNKISAAHKMFVEAKKMIGINSKAISPQLTIGNDAFSDFNYTTQKPGADDQHLGLLGNDLLKRFNVILDNRNGYIYLKPNSLVNAPYANPEYYVVRVIAGILILMMPLIVFIRYRRKKRRETNVLV